MENLNEFSADTKAILGLQLPTDPRWINLAEKSMEEILADHAWCEQKAATSCISLIQGFSDKEIAAVMKYKSPDVVKTSRLRCLEKLRHLYNVNTK